MKGREMRNIDWSDKTEDKALTFVEPCLIPAMFMCLSRPQKDQEWSLSKKLGIP